MSGNRSEKASLIMKSLGFKIIYHYKKGYNDWIKD
jgi:rhodanese-related sulfurtransferase